MGDRSGFSASLSSCEHLVPVLLPGHVDEVDDDDAAQVPQAHLARDLPGRLQVGLEDRLLEIVLADVLARC